jgi:hypothetical protein
MEKRLRGDTLLQENVAELYKQEVAALDDAPEKYNCANSETQ